MRNTKDSNAFQLCFFTNSEIDMRSENSINTSICIPEESVKEPTKRISWLGSDNPDSTSAQNSPNYENSKHGQLFRDVYEFSEVNSRLEKAEQYCDLYFKQRSLDCTSPESLQKMMELQEKCQKTQHEVHFSLSQAIPFYFARIPSTIIHKVLLVCMLSRFDIIFVYLYLENDHLFHTHISIHLVINTFGVVTPGSFGQIRPPKLHTCSWNWKRPHGVWYHPKWQKCLVSSAENLTKGIVPISQADLNTVLMNSLVERDELHLEHGAKLTDLDDLLAYLKELCIRVSIRRYRRQNSVNYVGDNFTPEIKGESVHAVRESSEQASKGLSEKRKRASSNPSQSWGTQSCGRWTLRQRLASAFSRQNSTTC
ncbi:hypothetical protein D915_000245 [Fasciola hepatica]|uniref:Uncharacterized protein n=1 Tax=Fasciola hepatica TaxID=6192 RepID=A0A4E0RYG6_FASHE|nr:hypothetical protein D915_000245 [Fasciola hepatica]